ncbi:hypothetical protein DFS34DRAFT_376567 [Phlyctochytrium arcticum]|nr:hypothetical protein DFS34DRAFT_376567 [Phlyctochytrium arcticum]
MSLVKTVCILVRIARPQRRISSVIHSGGSRFVHGSRIRDKTDRSDARTGNIPNDRFSDLKRSIQPSDADSTPSQSQLDPPVKPSLDSSTANETYLQSLLSEKDTKKAVSSALEFIRSMLKRDMLPSSQVVTQLFQLLSSSKSETDFAALVKIAKQIGQLWRHLGKPGPEPFDEKCLIQVTGEMAVAGYLAGIMPLYNLMVELYPTPAPAQPLYRDLVRSLLDKGEQQAAYMIYRLIDPSLKKKFWTFDIHIDLMEHWALSSDIFKFKVAYENIKELKKLSSIPPQVYDNLIQIYASRPGLDTLQMARRMMNDMTNYTKRVPNVYSMVLLIKACEQFYDGRAARQFFEAAEEAYRDLPILAHNAVMLCFAHAGIPSAVTRVTKNMQKHNIHFDASSWFALLWLNLRNNVDSGPTLTRMRKEGYTYPPTLIDKVQKLAMTADVTSAKQLWLSQLRQYGKPVPPEESVETAVSNFHLYNAEYTAPIRLLKNKEMYGKNYASRRESVQGQSWQKRR